MGLQKFVYNQEFKFENGASLPHLEIGYHTYGTLNNEKDNVVWVCHALTANSDVLDWWPGFFGTGQQFNPETHFIVCANILGSNYGTSNPLSINPNTQNHYFLEFPQYTIRDIVNAHIILANHLQIDKINVLIGGSLGGQQSLEWAIKEPKRIKNLIVIASNAEHSPWGIAFNESQRLALLADNSFHTKDPKGGSNGLKAARSIALLSYRSHQTYNTSQKETTLNKLDNFNASSYQSYQGQKLVNRFNAFSYWYLTKVMDSHNVGRNRNSIEEALCLIKARTLIVGVSSDILFPPDEQRLLARHIPNAEYEEIDSFYGHDGFLIETATLSHITKTFLLK